MERVDTFAEPDVVLIGGGIMSATLGVLLHQLEPQWKIQIVEALDEVAKESSNPWNNAGTGHAALCELNYTKENADGTIDISKAIEINEAFEVSKQFWAALVRTGILPSPESFITRVPHMSFVAGATNQNFLKRRFATMTAHHFFREMEYTENPETISQWAPLLLAGRQPTAPLAATRAAGGTDVNFGTLTSYLFQYLASKENVKVARRHLVRNIKRKEDGRWKLKVRNLEKNINRNVAAPFVFVGAGGASLPLLQKSGIPEGRGFGGFPVSGQFLVCDNPEIVDRHHAKVYGQAEVGAPPMSVPHLDTRIIDGKRSLLFGPFAGFSPKFLKTGSFFDLPGSVKISNLIPMLAVGKDNLDLTRYLIDQVRQSPQDRIDALKTFFPAASLGDWRLVTAGQRVQIIKKDDDKGGILQFGTEVVSAEDGSIAALLGASPGASTAVDVMLTVMQRCFASKMPDWQPVLKTLVPSYGKSLADHPDWYQEIRSHSDKTLGLG